MRAPPPRGRGSRPPFSKYARGFSSELC
jgi:hypothetical protein